MSRRNLVMNRKIDAQKVTMLIPIKILTEVEKYQEENSIPNRTMAFLELVRKGLNKKNRL
jgi:metal-responsive CopG/Arc/MetJ family transcriptional regulator